MQFVFEDKLLYFDMTQAIKALASFSIREEVDTPAISLTCTIIENVLLEGGLGKG